MQTNVKTMSERKREKSKTKQRAVGRETIGGPPSTRPDGAKGVPHQSKGRALSTLGPEILC